MNSALKPNPDLTKALDRATSSLTDGGADKGLASKLKSLATKLASDKGDEATQKRRAALGETLIGIAKRLAS